MVEYMFELNDIQADKICEIINVYFDHYEKAQYETDPYNDTEPQYYFYSEPMGHSSFKINRVTGELKWDSFKQMSFEFMENDFFKGMEDLFKNDKEMMDKINDNNKRIQKNNDLKQKVIDYLKSEKLL